MRFYAGFDWNERAVHNAMQFNTQHRTDSRTLPSKYITQEKRTRKNVTQLKMVWRMNEGIMHTIRLPVQSKHTYNL